MATDEFFTADTLIVDGLAVVVFIVASEVLTNASEGYMVFTRFAIELNWCDSVVVSVNFSFLVESALLFFFVSGLFVAFLHFLVSAAGGEEVNLVL